MKIHAQHHSLPKTGEYANGDRAFVRGDEQGLALFGVIDGLGHGPDAEAASLKATAYLERASLQLPLLDIMEQLHVAVSGTRGVAATVCILRQGVLDVCAVGNVELRSGDVRFPLVYSAGIVGVNVRKFRICSAPVLRPARFVAFSDGISSRTSTDDIRLMTPGDACRFIMQKHRRETDDATVLVADLE